MFQKLTLLFYAFYDLKLLISFLQVYVKCILNLKNRFSKDFRGIREILYFNRNAVLKETRAQVYHATFQYSEHLFFVPLTMERLFQLEFLFTN